ILDAMLGEGDDVHVTLDDHRAARGTDRGPRLEQAVELAALREKRRFGRVHVFGLALADDATPKAHHMATSVVDRVYDAVPEPVVALAGVSDDHEAGRLEGFVLVI